MHVFSDVLKAKDVTTASVTRLNDVTRQGFKLEVPDKVRHVRERPLDVHRDLVHSFQSLHIVDECRISHENSRNRRDGRGIVSDGGLVDLVQELGLHVKERLQRLVTGGYIGVNQPEENLLIASDGIDVVLNSKTSRLVDASRVICEVVEGWQHLIGQGCRHNDKSTIDLLIMLGGTDIEAGHNAEAVRAALERLPQICVLLLIGVDDLAACEDNLVVDDVVGNKPHLARKPSKSVSIQDHASLRLFLMKVAACTYE